MSVLARCYNVIDITKLQKEKDWETSLWFEEGKQIDY